MKNQFYTYNQVPENVIQIVWEADKKTITNNDAVESWKKNKDIEIVATLKIDNNEFCKYIEKNSSIAFFLLYHSPVKSGGTSLHNLIYKIVYYPEKNQKEQIVKLSGRIEGRLIAGALDLSLIAAVEYSPSSTSNTIKQINNIFAVEKGVKVYEDTIHIILEGDQSLFPTKVIDFQERDDISPDALYFLSRNSSDLDTSFSIAYTLFFNKSHFLFKKIENDNSDDDNVKNLLQLIKYDVYKSIIYDALDEDTGLFDLNELSEDIDSSLQFVYSSLVKQIIMNSFPGKTLSDMKQLAVEKSMQNVLNTAIQSFIFEDL